jgi:hypothetical protein
MTLNSWISIVKIFSGTEIMVGFLVCWGSHIRKDLSQDPEMMASRECQRNILEMDFQVLEYWKGNGFLRGGSGGVSEGGPVAEE